MNESIDPMTSCLDAEVPFHALNNGERGSGYVCVHEVPVQYSVGQYFEEHNNMRCTELHMDGTLENNRLRLLLFSSM